MQPIQEPFRDVFDYPISEAIQGYSLLTEAGDAIRSENNEEILSE